MGRQKSLNTRMGSDAAEQTTSKLKGEAGGGGSLADSVAGKYEQMNSKMGAGMGLASAMAGEETSLDSATMGKLQQMIGQPLDDVKVFAGKHTDMAARSLGAEAFAVEKNVFFRQGRLESGSADGIGLLAHEMLHTVQDGGLSKDDREAQASSLEHKAAAGDRGGQSRELAMDQAPPLMAPETMGKAAGAAPQAASAEQPKPDNDLIERLLFDRLVELLQEEATEVRERFGMM